jgi:hypothetical protein
MGNATLFGLSPDDWKNLASFFVTPAVALAVVYIFGIDLVKIPFVQTEVPYTLSTRTVSVFAIFLCLISSVATAIWLTLKVSPGPEPAVDKFLEQFFRQPSREETAWAASFDNSRIRSANLLLISYDGISDFRVFINSNRIFGTHVDCVWKYQCGNPSQNKMTQDMVIAKSKGMTFNPLFDMSAVSELPSVNHLPILRDFTSKMRDGVNYIDIFSNNPGFRGCHVEFDIAFVGQSGQEYRHHFRIADGVFTEKPYRTIPEEPYFRACDQLRIPVKVNL